MTEKGKTRDPKDLYTWKISGEFTSGTNILGLVFFAGKSNCYIYRKYTKIIYQYFQKLTFMFLLTFCTPASSNIHLTLRRVSECQLMLKFIAVIMGVTLAIMEERGKPLLDFFPCLSEAMMTITTWVIYMAPIGVFFLIGGQILEMEDLSVVTGQLGFYFMTVLVGLFVHGFVVLPMIFTICTRQLPFR